MVLLHRPVASRPRFLAPPVQSLEYLRLQVPGRESSQYTGRLVRYRAIAFYGLPRTAILRVVRSAAHIGAPYWAIDRTTPTYRRLQAVLGLPKLGSSVESAPAAPCNLGASRWKWGPKSHRLSSTNPRYFMVHSTAIQTPPTTMCEPGGGVRRGP